MMKYLFLAIAFFSQINVQAQKQCDYSRNFTDSIGTYKATKEYIVHERNFAGKSSYVFFSLVNADGLPALNFQLIEKSADFLKANCFDKSSKIYLQLTNGKVVTMLHTDDESCGTMVNIKEENKYSRILTGSFLFMKGTIEDLKSSPVSLIRVKYTTEIIDYVFRKELVSELTKEAYQPEDYFINYLKCIE
jgi:hypothetical protein